MSCDCEQRLQEIAAASVDDAIGKTVPSPTSAHPSAEYVTNASREMLLAQWQQQLGAQPVTAPPEPCEITTAKQLCKACHIRLKPADALLLDAGMTPRQFYESLLRTDCLAAARRVLAHTLPKRRALWWGCLVAMDVEKHHDVPDIALVLPEIVQFVIDPTEANRRRTHEVAKQVPASSLAGSLAMAAFLSGGSISLPHLPPVHPRAFVTGRLVGVTVYLASVIRSAAQYKDHLRYYLGLGQQVARGRLLWSAESPDEYSSIIRHDDGRSHHTVPEPHRANTDGIELTDGTDTVAATIAPQESVIRSTDAS